MMVRMDPGFENRAEMPTGCYFAHARNWQHTLSPELVDKFVPSKDR